MREKGCREIIDNISAASFLHFFKNKAPLIHWQIAVLIKGQGRRLIQEHDDRSGQYQ